MTSTSTTNSTTSDTSNITTITIRTYRANTTAITLKTTTIPTITSKTTTATTITTTHTATTKNFLLAFSLTPLSKITFSLLADVSEDFQEHDALPTCKGILWLPKNKQTTKQG